MENTGFHVGETLPLGLEKGHIWIQTDAYPRIRSFTEDFSGIRIDALEFPTILDLYGDNGKDSYDIVDADGNVVLSFGLGSLSPASMGDEVFPTHEISPTEPLDGTKIPDTDLFLDFRGVIPVIYKWNFDGRRLIPLKSGDIHTKADNSIYLAGERLMVNINGKEKTIPLMASSLDEVIENLEGKGGDIVNGVTDAVSDISSKLMKEGVEEFNKTYGKELERILKIKDIEKNAEILERKTRKGISERKNREGSSNDAGQAKYDFLQVFDINLEKNYITVAGKEDVIYTEGEKIGALYRERIPTIEITFSHELTATNVDKALVDIDTDIELHVSGRSLTIPISEFADKFLSLDAVAEKITKYLKTIEPTFSCTASTHKLIFRNFGANKFGPTSGIHANNIDGLLQIVRKFGVEGELVEIPWKPEEIERELTIKAVIKDTNSNKAMIFTEESLSGRDAMHLVSVAIAPFVTSDAQAINVKTAKMVYNPRLFGVGVKRLFSRGDDGFSGFYVSMGDEDHKIPKGVPYVALPTKKGVNYLVAGENGPQVIKAGDTYAPAIEYHTVEITGGVVKSFNFNETNVKMVTVSPSDSNIHYQIGDNMVLLEAPQGIDGKVVIKIER